jgi:hypothetical protein
MASHLKNIGKKPAAKLKMTVRDRTSVPSSNSLVVVHETVSRKQTPLTTQPLHVGLVFSNVNQGLIRHGELASVY